MIRRRPISTRTDTRFPDTTLFRSVIDVTVLRRGRTMSQLTATVRNPDAEAGLTAIAAFGATRRGFEFTELVMPDVAGPEGVRGFRRSEEHTSELQSLMRISYAVFCLKKTQKITQHRLNTDTT